MRFKLTMAALAVTLLATGCTPVDHSFGDAVAYAKQIQTIDPDPQYPEGSAEPGDSGQVAADAARAHRTGNVKQPSTQSGGRGGSSLGGGGSSRSSGPI